METVKRFVCLCLFRGDAISIMFIRSTTAENSRCYERKYCAIGQ